MEETMKYTSTLLASEPTTQEVRKADLDLLKKINEQADRIDTNSQSIISTDKTVSALPVVGANYLINSNFNRWDYATSQTSSGYGSDNRWSNENTGTTKTHSQQPSGDTERALFSSPYYSRTAITSVAGVGNFCNKLQRIEDVTKLAGKTITLSFWAKADSSKNIAIEFRQNGGTGGFAALTASPQKIALTNTWQKITRTITLPSIIGKTLGTLNTSFTTMLIWFDAGSNFNVNTDSLGQQSGTFDIAEVKIEEGTVATPWCGYSGEFGGEVEACARYLPAFLGNSNNFIGMANTTTSAYITVPFNTTTRIAPTGITVSLASHFNNLDIIAVNSASSAIAFDSSGKNSALINSTGAGFTVGRPTWIRANTALASLIFTGAEL